MNDDHACWRSCVFSLRARTTEHVTEARGQDIICKCDDFHPVYTVVTKSWEQQFQKQAAKQKEPSESAASMVRVL